MLTGYDTSPDLRNRMCLNLLKQISSCTFSPDFTTVVIQHLAHRSPPPLLSPLSNSVLIHALTFLLMEDGFGTFVRDERCLFCIQRPFESVFVMTHGSCSSCSILNEEVFCKQENKLGPSPNNSFYEFIPSNCLLSPNLRL